MLICLLSSCVLVCLLSSWHSCVLVCLSTHWVTMCAYVCFHHEGHHGRGTFFLLTECYQVYAVCLFYPQKVTTRCVCMSFYSLGHQVCLHIFPTQRVTMCVCMPVLLTVSSRTSISFLLTVSPCVSVCLFYSQSGGEAIKQRYYDAGGEISARQLPEKLRDRCQGLRIISLVDVTIANGGRRSERLARSISSKCKTFFLS